MKTSATQLAERKPVWNAMSELFLDTELQADDLDRIAVVLAASPYPEKKLEDILRFEVTPVLKWNMMAIAGEWAGFDEDWLVAKLSPRIDQAPLFKFGVSRMIRSDWRDIKAKIKNYRK